MAIIDVTRSYDRLVAIGDEVGNEASKSLAQLDSDHPLLANITARLLREDSSQNSIFRLIPFPIMGALGSDPKQAFPLAVASRIWWTGVEVFDDLSDGHNKAIADENNSAQIAVASAACIVAIPLAILNEKMPQTGLATGWEREFVSSSMSAAEGQLADINPSVDAPTWATVMKIYAAKSGSPYARDAAIASRLAGADDKQERGWRAFGKLFGVLRQLANDRAAESPDVDEDLINGTRTLLIAHAIELATSNGDMDSLMELRIQAQSDPEARKSLTELLLAPTVSNSYNKRIKEIHQKLGSIVQDLVPNSDHRNLIHWMLSISSRSAQLGDSRRSQ
ncbi:polyprenyl synthetase family protein [Streptomyces sp. IB201691-2A2]|uniref:polyprenyl synthetase family protein n=1 Tax=Streptomyces sp. IB201691-2A2 TaxID=2561920 RepID=UPI00117EED6A|nr:polyprenyl synthetase family protein [Streptomyces sp. IB201691-2A2]TRO55449.1 hypothetical protein E4K73_50510 [Streptomyces sp. IB201691-2A2]